MVRFMSVLLAVILYATNAFAAGKNDSLQIKGSDTMVNLGQAWAEEYMKKNPADFIAVTGGGSGTGMASLISGTCNIAMSSRNIKQKEIDQDKAKGHTPVEIKVALDGIAVVVSPKNPVGKLTLDQLAGIFSGKIKIYERDNALFSSFNDIFWSYFIEFLIIEFTNIGGSK